MAHPQERQAITRTRLVLRVIAGVVAASAATVFLLAIWMVVSSRFGWDDRDVHGYSLLFGTPIALFAGLVMAVSFPLALPPAHRSRTRAVSLGVLAATVVLLVIAVVTA
ncbi:hypothetical protein [Plantibacter cousiniae (nom. nud.)]|uniref:hypothetical protein n=1 Tax=Plantibacter cousiniae (nom. nud.) TaxID=199709 RepID=UPI001D8C8C45|nr:hypothetical protein [Plantibacter cousiniae]CAH0140108.1 hypothetical protein SRABI02_00506 [Plantibacter cousiniae]